MNYLPTFSCISHNLNVQQHTLTSKWCYAWIKHDFGKQMLAIRLWFSLLVLFSSKSVRNTVQSNRIAQKPRTIPFAMLLRHAIYSAQPTKEANHRHINGCKSILRSFRMEKRNSNIDLLHIAHPTHRFYVEHSCKSIIQVSCMQAASQRGANTRCKKMEISSAI